MQLTGRTMCDRIVVFDAPLRLVGRLVDVDIQAAGAWSLAGTVADGLAEAVPLEHLFEDAQPAASSVVYDIDLAAVAGRRPVSAGHSGPPAADAASGA
jgi:hypothetical protein